ncbi:MAG: TatD family hydrolase [Gammaproteobacteria bacterium]|nr:TatD family hydrolase [Gammaproteobacteria bacterium]MDD9896228.1 TatD family hydrolase [Gammaproteobacteria bacterium]MDD9958233.1 TatD family hydrolase [Gammaproteobacteria bacterium]
MQLIDIGANLTHQSFENDFEQVIANAKKANLGHIILTGTDLATSKAAQLMAKERPQFFSATVGFHPHIAANVTIELLQEAEVLTNKDQVVAIGETGLDFNRNYSPRADQLRVFEHHLMLATKINKPLFLHQRDAHADFLALLRQYRSEVIGGVVHCFTDTVDALRDYLDLDMHIGITGWICDERRGQDLQQAVKYIPLERLLIETDAPYLLPRSLKPKPKSRRNEPAHLIEVARTIASHTDNPLEKIIEQTSTNAKLLFRLPEGL